MMIPALPSYSVRLPRGAGVGYKPCHFEDIRQNPGELAWLEIHAENYMGQGGRLIAQLKEMRAQYPVSCHGVGLSIGGEAPLDKAHLERLKHLLEWLEPAQFSEHLAWSSHGQNFYNDLLPLPYTQATLDRVVAHIDQVQETLNRKMLLENPSNYLAFSESELSETDFLCEVVARTGCGLLLDINNVYISAINRNFSPQSYIDRFPLQAVGEFHLAGYEKDVDDAGAPLLIDTHSRHVSDPVWALYQYTLARSGPRPTLIEWDNDIPAWSVLREEIAAATGYLQASEKVAAQ